MDAENTGTTVKTSTVRAAGWWCDSHIIRILLARSSVLYLLRDLTQTRLIFLDPRRFPVQALLRSQSGFRV